MRKSGWAAAAGLGSLALLLAACGGSSGSSGSGGSTATPTTTAAGQATGVALNPPGTTVLIVQKSNLGYVLADLHRVVRLDLARGHRQPEVPVGRYPARHARHRQHGERRQADHLQRLPPVHLQGREAALDDR